jgi:hypothetical protein
MYNSLQKQEIYINKLPQSIKKSLYWYTTEEYKDFNKRKRDGRLLTSEQRTHYENLLTAFYDVPPTKSVIVVYRGSTTIDGFSTKSFTSTTLDKSETKKFTGRHCCLIEITVSPGSKVIPLRTISENPVEEEVLLDQGGTYISTSTTINEQMKTLFLTYIPEISQVVHNKDELKQAETVLDNGLIIERLVTFYEDDDPEDVDEDDIKIMYKKITNGKTIPPKDLEKVKNRIYKII